MVKSIKKAQVMTRTKGERIKHLEIDSWIRHWSEFYFCLYSFSYQKGKNVPWSLADGLGQIAAVLDSKKNTCSYEQ